MGLNTIVKIILKIINGRLENEMKSIFEHTIIMKIGSQLAIIVHYTVQFNLVCCKSFVPDLGPNIILKIIEIIKRRIKSKIK